MDDPFPDQDGLQAEFDDAMDGDAVSEPVIAPWEPAEHEPNDSEMHLSFTCSSPSSTVGSAIVDEPDLTIFYDAVEEIFEDCIEPDDAATSGTPDGQWRQKD